MRVDGVVKDVTTDYTVTGVGARPVGTWCFCPAPPATAPANVDFIAWARRGDHWNDHLRTVRDYRRAGRCLGAAVASVELQHRRYPSAVVLHEQRLWGANTASHPQSEWGSKSGLFFDFTPGPNDDDAVYKTIDSRQSNPIRYMHSGKATMALTDSSEWEMRGGVEKPIAQSNFSAKRQSGWGCAQVKPEEVVTTWCLCSAAAKCCARPTP